MVDVTDEQLFHTTHTQHIVRRTSLASEWRPIGKIGKMVQITIVLWEDNQISNEHYRIDSSATPLSHRLLQ